MAKNFASSTAASSTKPARKSRAKKTDATVEFNSATSIAADDEFSRLLAAVGGAPDMAPVVTIEPDAAITERAAEADELDAALAAMVADEPIVPAAESSEEVDLSDLEAAVSRSEAADIMLAAASEDAFDVGAAPTEGEPAAPAKAKKERTPRKLYADKIERLKDRVGESLSEYSVLTTADALVDETELAAVMERTLEIMRAMNSKEKNRASNLIEFLSGKRAKLNNVLERVLRVLDRDGFIQTGAEGNVIKDLIARPYSMASARAMGGNTIGVYADLKLIVPEGKGKFVANPDSLLLAKARALLSAVAATTASDAEEAELEGAAA